jgi:hypothetical protein
VQGWPDSIRNRATGEAARNTLAAKQPASKPKTKKIDAVVDKIELHIDKTEK